MKYSKSSVLFTTIILSGAAVHASEVANKDGHSVDTTASSIWKYFGFGGKSKAVVPVVEAKAEVADESWSLVNPIIGSDDEYDFVLEKESIAKGELEAHRLEEEKRAQESFEKARQERVKKAQEEEGLLAWAMPNKPKVSAKWHNNQQAPPVLLQEKYAQMMIESEEEQEEEQVEEPRPVQPLEVFAEQDAIMRSDPEDEQPEPEVAPVMDDSIPDAPPMDAIPSLAPVQMSNENAEKPKEPNVFRGKTAIKMGISASDESAASQEELLLIQRLKAKFQGAGSRAQRYDIIEEVNQMVREKPQFQELHKLAMTLKLELNREVLEVDDASDDEEVDFD